MTDGLLLLHAFPLDARMWRAQVEALADRVPVVAPNHPGFGGSEPVPDVMTMDLAASSAVRAMDEAGLERAVVCGLSMGGYVALAFARLFPERVGGLGLVSSQVLDDAPERREGRYKSAAEVADKGIASVVETMAPKFTADARLQEYARASMEKQPPAAYIGALKAMAERADSTSLLSTINYPVVLIHGDSDALIPVDRAREVKASFPQSHFVEIRGAGHMPMMEAREQTAEALRNLA